MKYWLIFTGLIMVNGIVWLTVSNPSIDNYAGNVKTSNIAASKQQAIVDLPFEVVSPEKITLQAESALSNGRCMLIGPFSQNIVAAEMQKVLLEKKAIEFASTQEQVQNILVYRVYIGPLDEERLNKVVAQLNDVNVTDHYLFGFNNNGSNVTQEKVISLGVYGYKENANAYATQLNKIGFDTKVAAEKTDVIARIWLSTDNDSIDDEAVQKEIEDIVLEESIKISRFGQIKVDIFTRCPL